MATKPRSSPQEAKPQVVDAEAVAVTSPVVETAPAKAPGKRAPRAKKSAAKAATKGAAKAKTKSSDDEDSDDADGAPASARSSEGDDGESTEVAAEVVGDVDAAPLGDDDEEGAEDEALTEGLIDDDDDSAPRRRKIVAYADDPERKTAALSHFDPMQAYLREVQRHPLLTPEQEHDYATKYFSHGDVRAAHTLVTSNLRLVVKIAYEYRRAYKNIMDLVQEGNVGLMQAVKKYDPTRGVKLSSYAAWWIRAYILRYILNNWRMVKLGTTQAQRKLFFNLNKEKQRLLALGIDPTYKAIAERLEVDEKEVSEMDVRLGASEASIDAPIGGDSEGKPLTRGDTMASNQEAADVMLAEAEMQSALKGKLKTFRTTLKGKDLEIFDLRLAAQDDPLTLQELGDKFGVSRERVRQLEARLVGKLRVHLKAELEEAQRAES